MRRMSKMIWVSTMSFFAVFTFPAKTFAVSIINNPTGGPVKDKSAVTDLINRLTTIVVGVAGIIAVAMIVYGGVLYITSGGNEERQKKAKTVLTYAIFGLVFTISAYVIIYIFTKALGGGIS